MIGVLQHHQKWFMIDLDHFASFSYFTNFHESFFFILLLLCQTSNWWMMSGRTFSWNARICKWGSIVMLCILTLYNGLRHERVKAIRLFHFFKQCNKANFFITTEFATQSTLVSVKLIILFDCWSMKLYIPYLALKPSESHRQSPITFRVAWVFSSDTILFLCFR